MFDRRAKLAVTMLFVGACSSPTPPAAEPTASATAAPEPEPPMEPVAEPVETGKDCATATALCFGNGCTLKLKNDCEVPLTCDAFILLRCRTPTDLVQARGRGRQTFPQKSEAELPITANCTMGKLAATSFDELKCQ